MTKFKIAGLLTGMVGKQFTYKLKEHRVFRFIAGEDQFKITTDKEDLVIKNEDAKEFFDNFLFIEESKPFVPAKNKQFQLRNHAPTERKELVLPETSLTVNSGKLSTTIFDAIEKVKESHEYIPQAQAINELLKTNIDLAKAEVELIKAVMR